MGGSGGGGSAGADARRRTRCCLCRLRLGLARGRGVLLGLRLGARLGVRLVAAGLLSTGLLSTRLRFRRRAAVGAVEAAALEHHADGAEHLAQGATARRAHPQRLVAERLHHLDVLAAVAARVLVGRHGDINLTDRPPRSVSSPAGPHPRLLAEVGPLPHPAQSYDWDVDVAVAAVLVAASYALGGYSTALAVGRATGHDPTREGSHNPGASNVYRLSGTRAGLVAFAGDLAKGVAAAGGGELVG